jgi:hypothetical protein
MAIIEIVPVEIADVQVNNEYRIELSQFRLTTDYTPTQARTLALLLTRAAERAELATNQDNVTPIGRGPIAAKEVI